MFWTRWVRGFCAALVIATVGAAVYYGKTIIDAGGKQAYYKGMGIIAIALIGSLTAVSLILMISEIALSVHNLNKKVEDLSETVEEQGKKAAQTPVMPQMFPYPQPMIYQAPPIQQYVPQQQYPQISQPYSGMQFPIVPGENQNPPKGAWHCACGQKNSAKAKFCGKCGLPRNIQ